MNLSIISGLMSKYYYITINRLDRIFDIVYWPVIGLILWGFTSNSLKGIAGEKIVLMFLGATVLWIFFQRAAQDISVYVLEDFWSRNLYNLFATPMKVSDLVISVTLFGAIRSLMGAVVLTASALLFYSFNILSMGAVVAAMSSFNLLLFGWVIGLFVSSFIFRYGTRIQVLAWSIPFLLQPFSAVYYPLSSMPAFIQKISWILPSTHVFEGMRYAYDTGLVSWSHLGMAAVLNLIMLVLVCFLFSNAVNAAKKKGIFVRRE